MSPIRFLLITLIAIALVGCSSNEPTSLLVSTPTRVVLPTSIATSILTAAPNLSSTATRVIVPTAAPSATPTARTLPPATTTVPAGTMKIKLFFIALDDGGQAGKKIGCNDSVVAVERAMPQTQSVLTAALKELLATRERNIGQSGLYNALAQANLNIDGVAVVDGKAIINLSGTLGLGGVCDDPRAEAQLKELALQFPTVKEVSITLNGIPIEKALSGKGN